MISEMELEQGFSRFEAWRTNIYREHMRQKEADPAYQIPRIIEVAQTLTYDQYRALHLLFSGG